MCVCARAREIACARPCACTCVSVIERVRTEIAHGGSRVQGCRAALTSRRRRRPPPPQRSKGLPFLQSSFRSPSRTFRHASVQRRSIWDALSGRGRFGPGRGCCLLQTLICCRSTNQRCQHSLTLRLLWWWRLYLRPSPLTCRPCCSRHRPSRQKPRRHRHRHRRLDTEKRHYATGRTAQGCEGKPAQRKQQHNASSISQRLKPPPPPPPPPPPLASKGITAWARKARATIAAFCSISGMLSATDDCAG